MTPLLISEVRFCHNNQLEKPQFAKSRNFSSPILKVKGRWGAVNPQCLALFENL